MTTKFQPGEAVAVPAIVQPGAFPDEHLVTVSTKSGPISGFVRDQDVVEPGKTIQGIVRQSTPQSVTVQLSGSYFTTNGFVEFSTDWAQANIKATA